MNASAEKAQPEIRVLIADDSAVMRTALSRMIESSPTVRVCGTARNGLETVEKIKLLKPDVVTLDIRMPVLDGIEALKRIMGECPCPVIMVSSLTTEGAEITVEALSAGAFDYLSKETCRAIPICSSYNEIFSKRLRRLHRAYVALREKSQVVPRIAIIGTSTGGPKALQAIIPKLPEDLPIPVLVVQHMPKGFTAPLAKRLNGLSKVKVCEASHGEQLKSGTVYVAPAGRQTTLYSSGSQICVCLSDTPNDTTHKPSVDVTMSSVAVVFARYVLGIILTGMGSDGARGMRAIQDAGGITVGQDEATCAVYGMPRTCADNGVLQRVVPLDEVASVILESVRYRARQ